jgi:phosphoribosylformimino-5-aminoimidazole carboxamide ribotide isomerase
MQIVPVIDLMGGLVVHARRGERERYQPLSSTLCQGAEPLTVVEALLGLYPFPALYIADLDAIQGRGDHAAVVAAIRRAHPALQIWLDAAVTDRNAFEALTARALCVPVIGSESLRSIAWLAELAPQASILSLDHRDGERLGPSELWQQPQLWPQRVLAMNLRRVGGAEGPDLDLIRTLQQTRPGVQVFAAGGVRDMRDIDVLRGSGAAGALVATALHSGAISSTALHSGAIARSTLQSSAIS